MAFINHWIQEMIFDYKIHIINTFFGFHSFHLIVGLLIDLIQNNFYINKYIFLAFIKKFVMNCIINT